VVYTMLQMKLKGKMRMKIFIIVLFCAFILVSLCRFLSRWLNFGKRKLIPLKDTYQESHLDKKISYDDFKKIMQCIGDSYKIEPEKLRLNDSFRGNLGALDSFVLDHYADTLEDRLKNEFKIIIDKPVDTIADLMNIYFH